MQKLISIITPTYNYGHLIYRLLDSILQQTYNNIEMFVIDDGSTDNTKKIIEAYFEKFQKRGYRLSYSYQRNQRQAVALNNGLKMITGDYLVWPDADDWYTEPNALEIMATVLDGTDDKISCCRSLAYFVNEQLAIIKKSRYEISEQLFRDCLFAKRGFVFAGTTMVKTHILFGEIDNRTIYTGNNYPAQNMQILLPVLYKYKCVFIDKYLMSILVNSNSASRRKYAYEERLKKTRAYCEVRRTILKNIRGMPNEEMEKIFCKISDEYDVSRFHIHFSYGKGREVRRTYNLMVAKNMFIPIKIKINYYFSFIPFYFSLYVTLRYVRRLLKKIMCF